MKKIESTRKSTASSLSEIVEVFDDPHLIDWYDKEHSSIIRKIDISALEDCMILLPFLWFSQNRVKIFTL